MKLTSSLFMQRRSCFRCTGILSGLTKYVRRGAWFILKNLWAKTGAMEQALTTYSKELANTPEEDHDHGEHFVMI